MNGKIFGITWGMILLVVLVAVVARWKGGVVPFLKNVPVG